MEPGAFGSTGAPEVPLEPGVLALPGIGIEPEVVGEVCWVSAPLYMPPLEPEEPELIVAPEPLDGAVLMRSEPVEHAANTIAQAAGIIHLNLII